MTPAVPSPSGQEEPHRDPPLVAVVGPTGIGKSALALEIAEAVGGEIVSVDSRQVYRGLEIGTAQPTAEELARVRHHLVGILEPDEPFSVALFVELTEQALRRIAARGSVALLVGGSYHYLEALLDRLKLPRVPPDWALRRKLEHEDASALCARLARLDPAATSIVQTGNRRRLIRALEVLVATGKPLAEAGRRKGEARAALRLALTMPRQALYERVDARVEAMLTAGWLDEVRRLLAAGYSPELPALTSTGYRELIRHLRGELTLDEATRLVKYSTHAFIRRQYAWLRRDTRLFWIEQGPGALTQALALTRAHLATSAEA
jgi:tRNA dimethylallyltransferase